MTDEMLAWQTERFTELAVSPETLRDHYVVPLWPEQSVEVAFDGIQDQRTQTRSTPSAPFSADSRHDRAWCTVVTAD